MLKKFYPHVYVKTVYDINYKYLMEKGIQNLIFDIDNTLAPFDIAQPDIKVKNHMKTLRKKGFHICLLSNNKESRVRLFSEPLHLPAVHRAAKPLSYGIRKAVNLLKAERKNTALIGDQVFTDVWCGRRNGLYTVLVQPMSVRDEWSVKLKRGLEKKVIDAYLNQCGKS